MYRMASQLYMTREWIKRVGGLQETQNTNMANKRESRRIREDWMA